MTNNKSALPLTTTDAAYIAGIIDGEGCIGVRIRGKYVHPRLEVVNTDKRLLLWMADVTGVGTVYTGKRIAGKLQKYNWIVSVKPACEVLRQTIPYMRVKRLQAHLFCAIGAFRRIPIKEQQPIKDITFTLADMVIKAKRGGRKSNSAEATAV